MNRRRSGGTSVLRTLGFIVAIALGVLSIWLIVTGNSTKNVRIGALSGFWGLLVGGFAIFGRHLQQPAGSSGVVDLRASGAMDRPEDAAARMEFEIRLVQMLRREVQATMTTEMQKMREDVASLRSEIIEKVGGDLRMERIETTRIFGSDIEALQREIAALKGQRVIEPDEPWTVEVVPEEAAQPPSRRVVPDEASEPAAAPPVPPVAPVAPQPVAAEQVGVAAKTVDERPPAPAYNPLVYAAPTAPPATAPPAPTPVEPVLPEPAAAPTAYAPPAPAPYVEPAPSYVAAAEPPAAAAAPPTPFTPPEQPVTPPYAPPPVAEPTPPAYEPPAYEPPSYEAPAASFDDAFAALPRLQPFTDFELDDVPSARPVTAVPTTERPASPYDLNTRVGRRRAAEADEVGASHVPGGGRRRREGEAAENDLLAKILQREHPS